MRLVKRVILSLVVGYLILALIGRAREAAGVYRCERYPDCWCKKPALSMFRWVFPRFHRGPWLESQKRRLDISVRSYSPITSRAAPLPFPGSRSILLEDMRPFG